LLFSKRRAAMREPHVPILVKEVLHYFEGSHLKVFFEGTLGAGGHARALLAAHPEIELYIGCDKDPEALLRARERLQPWAHKIRFVQGDFADVERILQEAGQTGADGFFLTSEYHLCN
jgi:16S rRNA (cytosine1402-N4)-methyltransferase